MCARIVEIPRLPIGEYFAYSTTFLTSSAVFVIGKRNPSAPASTHFVIPARVLSGNRTIEQKSDRRETVNSPESVV